MFFPLRYFRMFAAATLIFLVTSCAFYPNPYHYTGTKKLSATPIDASFPGLTFVDETEADASRTRTVNLAYQTDKQAMNFEYLISYDGTHFSNVAAETLKKFLLPSFSKSPQARALVYRQDSHQGNGEYLELSYFVNTDKNDNRIQNFHAELPACAHFEASYYPYSGESRIALAITIQFRSYVFLRNTASVARCPKIAIRDLIPEIEGLPEVFVSEEFLVYVIDFESAHLTTQPRKAVLIDSQNQAEFRHLSPVAVSEDPVLKQPEDPKTLVCDYSVFGYNTTTCLGMCATDRGPSHYSERCRAGP